MEIGGFPFCIRAVPFKQTQFAGVPVGVEPDHMLTRKPPCCFFQEPERQRQVDLSDLRISGSRDNDSAGQGSRDWPLSTSFTSCHRLVMLPG